MAASPADSTSPAVVRQPLHRLLEVLALYPSVRDDHLRTLQKCGLFAAPTLAGSERVISFADVVVIRQVHAELQRGTTFKAVLRALLASRDGQLALDFRVDRQPAKVIALRPPQAGGSQKRGPSPTCTSRTAPMAPSRMISCVKRASSVACP